VSRDMHNWVSAACLVAKIVLSICVCAHYLLNIERIFSTVEIFSVEGGG
jgi:hypothetical protein